METLSAPALSNRLTSSTLRTPPPTVRGMNTCAATSSTTCRINSSSDERELILHVVEEVAAQVFIPLTVGGGVRKVEDVRRLLNAGADKVSSNTAAVQNQIGR